MMNVGSSMRLSKGLLARWSFDAMIPPVALLTQSYQLKQKLLPNMTVSSMMNLCGLLLEASLADVLSAGEDELSPRLPFFGIEVGIVSCAPISEESSTLVFDHLIPKIILLLGVSNLALRVKRGHSGDVRGGKTLLGYRLVHAYSACWALLVDLGRAVTERANPKLSGGMITGSPKQIRLAQLLVVRCFGFDEHLNFLPNVRCGGTGGSSFDSTRDVIAGCLA
jgi:hypothetical protein